MLWDLIRDFFVQHVFGGFTSNGIGYYCSIGNLGYYESDHFEYELISTNTLNYQIQSNSPDGFPYFISVGDWLSTTATIISISIIIILMCLFVYKLVRIVGGLFSK